MGPQPGGCFKDLSVVVDSCNVCGARNKPCKHYQGEKEMNEMTIREFKALIVANDDAVEGKLYRATGTMPDPESTCVKRGANVYALRCIKVTHDESMAGLFKSLHVQMGLEEFILIDDECEDVGPPHIPQPEKSVCFGTVPPDEQEESEDCPSLPADRRYWARNRVVMKSIRQALLSFLYEMDSVENRRIMSEICTIRIQEDYPDCNMVLEYNPEDVLNKRYRFTLTEGSNVAHYGAEFTTGDEAVRASLFSGVKATRDVRVNIEGEENG